MNSPFKTVLIGFGQIAHGLSYDFLMARYFTYATHAQVLAKHPLFSWEAVVDPSDKAMALARKDWGISIVAGSIEELADRYQPEVAVIATPPDQRLDILDKLPTLRAVFVEKPLGKSFQEGCKFIEECKKRNLLVQVNFWRRGDEFFRRLAETELEKLIGRPQAVFGLYGNGLINNGSHIIDFARMLFGEVLEAEVIAPEYAFSEGPVTEDRNVAFCLKIENRLTAMFQPVHFENYRENCLDIWGEKGRLALYLESLGIYYYPRKKNRALQNEWEIASDRPRIYESTCSRALYRMYDNIADALMNGSDLWSPGESALRSEEVVHHLLDRFNEL